MAVSSPERSATGAAAAIAGLGLLLQACTIGNGDGEITGTVSAPDCNLEDAELDINPNFFAADPVEEILEIRVQKGSDFPDTSNGIAVSVLDANQVKEQLAGTADGEGVTVELGGPPSERLVNMSLYLGRKCEVENDRPPVVYDARSGSITFFEIYAPQVASGELETHAEFSGVRLDAGDDGDPEERNATISGFFQFLFARGRPAQPFP